MPSYIKTENILCCFSSKSHGELLNYLKCNLITFFVFNIVLRGVFDFVFIYARREETNIFTVNSSKIAILEKLWEKSTRSNFMSFVEIFLTRCNCISDGIEFELGRVFYYILLSSEQPWNMINTLFQHLSGKNCLLQAY